MEKGTIPENVDAYIASYPENIRPVLEKMRKAIRDAAPDAKEKISYRMPSYSINGLLAYYAAHTNHLGFYPLTSAIKKFKPELESYQTSKGTIQFPYNKPLPTGLIKKIIRFRVAENKSKSEKKVISKSK
jgi:uncharacterized protein YdhG (YjbR/CyaY superfamily)